MSGDGDPGPGIFPDQIVSEILTHLPAKSICRFKCVSKRWLSIISSSHFISSFLSLSSSSPPSWAILIRYIRVESVPNNPTLNISLSGPPAVSSLCITPLLSHGSSYAETPDEPENFVIAGGNGLLLFGVKRKLDPYMEEQHVLMVCNPVTRKWFQLAKPPEEISNLGGIGFATRVDPNSGQIVSFVVSEFQPILGSKHASLLTFSSETCMWEVKCGNYELGMHIWRQEGAFELDGHMFWLDLSFGLVIWDDPFSGKKAVECRFIPLPDGCLRPFDTPGLWNERSIGPGGGYIQYMEMKKGDDGLLSLWRFKDDGKIGEWNLVQKVLFNDIWRDESYLATGLPKVIPAPEIFHPFEGNVCVFVVRGCVVSLDVNAKKVVGCASSRSLLTNGRLWALPFVVPAWPTSLPPPIAAASEKDLGNEFFKGNKFDEAIRCYSRSINQSPTAVAYANRAAANLKMSRYVEAECDCTEALKFDGQYLKAFARRAIARKKLGKLREGEEDLKLALKLAPQQKQLLKQHAEIKTLLERGQGWVHLDLPRP